MSPYETVSHAYHICLYLRIYAVTSTDVYARTFEIPVGSLWHKSACALGVDLWQRSFRLKFQPLRGYSWLLKYRTFAMNVLDVVIAVGTLRKRGIAVLALVALHYREAQSHTKHENNAVGTPNQCLLPCTAWYREDYNTSNFDSIGCFAQHSCYILMKTSRTNVIGLVNNCLLIKLKNWSREPPNTHGSQSVWETLQNEMEWAHTEANVVSGQQSTDGTESLRSATYGVLVPRLSWTSAKTTTEEIHCWNTWGARRGSCCCLGKGFRIFTKFWKQMYSNRWMERDFRRNYLYPPQRSINLLNRFFIQHPKLRMFDTLSHRTVL